MVTMSKKEARKAGLASSSVSRSKATASESSKVTKAISTAEEEDESDWSSEDEDPENGGVSEKGMARLMALVDEGDLDEVEQARLAELGDAESGDEDDVEHDDDEDVEDDDEEEDEDEDLSGAEKLSDESEDDEDDEEDEDRPVNGKIVVTAAEADELDLDDIGSDVSVDEDAVPSRKVTINNGPALRIMTDRIKLSHLPFPEHLVVSSKDTIDVDPSDDLQRETAFYKLALEQVAPARKLAAKHNILFSRPADYYAEMVKSDEHMERVRTKLVEEAQGIQKSEAARKQRDLKKYGKQIQVEKLKQREMDKKGFQDKMQGIKRKRKDGMELDGEDDFGIEIDDGPSERGGPGGRGREKGKMPRHVRDSKYSLGGGGRRSKENTKESTSDYGGFNAGARGGGRGGSRGGRGGGRGGARGGASMASNRSRNNRPGKSRRAKA